MSEVRSEFMERLASEREAAPEAKASIPTEPVGDPEDVDVPVGEVDGTDNTEDVLDPETEADAGDPVDGEESEVSPEYMELEEKYKSLEAEFSRVTANRKEIEASLDTAKAQTVQMKHELEDRFREAESVAEYFAGMATQQLQQLQGVNPATLTQEQYGQYQQAYQQAQWQAQQYQQISEGVKKQLAEAKEATLQREAEIARERLKTRIPDWSSEKYKALGEVATEYGYSPEEFFSSTDYRLVLLLNEVQKGKDAAKAVTERSKQTKANPPKNRATRTPERNSQGQFTNAQKAFQESTPGTKGSFAAMKAAQLRAERMKQR